MIQRRYLILLLAVLFVLCGGVEVLAQCPMCRMAAESNLENGGTAGKGLNTGILYILCLPYLLVFTIGFIWYRKNKKAKQDEEVNQVVSDLLSEA